LGFAPVIGDFGRVDHQAQPGVKDSGNFLPGIGWRARFIDSLLFTAPLLFFYLRLVFDCLTNF